MIIFSISQNTGGVHWLKNICLGSSSSSSSPFASGFDDFGFDDQFRFFRWWFRGDFGDFDFDEFDFRLVFLDPPLPPHSLLIFENSPKFSFINVIEGVIRLTTRIWEKMREPGSKNTSLRIHGTLRRDSKGRNRS